MKRGTKPYDPRCLECHTPIDPESDHRRWNPVLQVMERVCADHRQGTRESLLEALSKLSG